MNAAMACGASKAKVNCTAAKPATPLCCAMPPAAQAVSAAQAAPETMASSPRAAWASASGGTSTGAAGRSSPRRSTAVAAQGLHLRQHNARQRLPPAKPDKPKETSMRVQNQSIIVTGAGSGIGEGIAKRLAAEGGKVIVNDIDAASGQRVVADITAAGGTASFFQADMTRSAQVEALIDEALRRNGRLDVMVNNAGWTHRNRPLLEVSEDEFDKVYAINVKSIYLSAIHAVPAMRKAGGGSFINIASTAGLRPRPGLTWYNGSKGAVITTSKSMAAELGPDNIRVNCINPVFNPDPGLSADFAGGPVDETRRAKFLATIPLGRFSTALDVANAVLYLASAEAAFISGVCLEVDGARCV